MRSYEAAEKILSVLEKHPGGVNMKMLLLLADVTPGQYRNAYNWTLDNLDEPVWVKTYVSKEFVYQTTENKGACKEDWQRTILTQVTRARREHSKIRAIAERHKTQANQLSEIQARHRLEMLQAEKERIT